jgi:hypothetical protein
MVKTSITLSEDLLKEARLHSRNISALVAEALREYFRKKRVEKAVETFGSCPKLGGDEDSVTAVNKLREGADRGYANGAH